jgi:hypothetical protein
MYVMITRGWTGGGMEEKVVWVMGDKAQFNGRNISWCPQHKGMTKDHNTLVYV